MTATSEAGATALETRELRVEFRIRGGDVARAVDGVDLAVRRGEIVALVGESGCGKTTLARTMLGLERPTRARSTSQARQLSYRARDLKAYRRRVQLILQDPSGALNPRHTVYEAVAEGLRVHGLHEGEEAKVADALSRAGLRPPERFFLRYPHELSGGQRQRVVIAGALVLDPDIIVADEPVSSLDASVRGEILALLLRLRDELGFDAARRHPRPRPGLEHRRPGGGHVPRSHRRGGPDRGDPVRAAAPLHQGAALGGSGDGAPSSRSCWPARRPTPPGSPPAAGSTRAAPRWRTARPPPQASMGSCRTVALPVLAAEVGADIHSSACHLVTAHAGR